MLTPLITNLHDQDREADELDREEGEAREDGAVTAARDVTHALEDARGEDDERGSLEE